MKEKFTFFFLLFSFSLMAQTQVGGDIDGEAAGDQSGRSVAINAAGDRIAIGANLNN